MLVSELFSQLKTKYSVNFQISDDMNLNMLQFYDNQEIDMNTLYFTSTCPSAPGTYICTELSGNILGNYCLIDSKDMVSLLNLITNLFHDENSKENQFQNLISFPTDTISFDELLENTANFLKRSIVVIDLSFRIIGYSKNIHITDKIWINNIKRGYCTYEFIQAIKDMLPDNLEANDTAFYVNCSASKENKLCTHLFYQNKPVGYLILLDNEKGIEQYHIQYLPRISEYISKSLKNMPNFYNMFINVGQTIFSSLLTNEELKEEELTVLTNLKFPERMVCSIISPIHDTKHDLFFLERSMKSYIPLSFIFTHEGKVVSIISETDMHLLDTFIKEFDHVIQYVGVSLSFTNIKHLQAQYEYAYSACKIGKKVNSANKKFLYDDYQIEDLLLHVDNKKLVLDSIHNSFEILREYDLNHDTELGTTLRTYIQCDRNGKETARILFLHRNTLSYRLNKIKEITNIDLEDSKTYLQLVLSIHILDLKDRKMLQK